MNDLMAIPVSGERQQWLIDLMSASEDAVEATFDKAETLDELMERYANCPVESIISKIYRMEDYLLTLPQVEIPVKHYVNNGIYYREITIPKGVFMTGSMYEGAHIHFVIRGDMTVMTEDGLKRVTGAQTFVSPPGVKRAGFAHEETVWAGVIRTDETDPDKAWAAVSRTNIHGLGKKWAEEFRNKSGEAA